MKSKRDVAGLIFVLAIAAFVAGLAYSGRNDPPVVHHAAKEKPDQQPPTPLPESVSLNGQVRFTGGQFLVKNLDSFDWKNVKMEINGGVFSSGYISRCDLLDAGNEFTFPAFKFAKPEGERFNPSAMKPNQFAISADTEKGRGHYGATWN